MRNIALVCWSIAAITSTVGTSGEAQCVELVGASYFDANQPASQTLQKFEEEVKACYSDDLLIRVFYNASLGIEEDYIEGMTAGSIDFAIVTPSSISNVSRTAALLDMPLLFRSEGHWREVLEGDALEPIANDILEESGVRIIGYAGGSVRNIFADHPIRNTEGLAGLDLRVLGGPVERRIFEALNVDPTTLPYGEVYTALQTGVLSAAESGAVGVEQMKFYEVSPHVSLTRHAIAMRLLAFSNQTYQSLAQDLQHCIDRAGRLAAKYGRELENRQDAETLLTMQERGHVEIHAFEDRDQLFDLAESAKRNFAAELGVLDTYEEITAIGCPDWCGTDNCGDSACHTCIVCEN